MKLVKLLERIQHAQQNLTEDVLRELLVQLQLSKLPVLRIVQAVIAIGLELHVLIRHVQMHQPQ